MKSKKRLGKGLGDLIPEHSFNDDVDVASKEVSEIDIDDIFPNEDQPRRNFDKQALVELENSIKRLGIIQPVVVRKVKKGYEIVAGERRWRASKNIGLKKIPTVIKDVSDVEQAQMALVENLQREDLNAIEEAEAYRALMDNYNFTQAEVSEIVGSSRSHVANTLRLLNLDDEIQQLIVNNEISAGHGRALLRIDDTEERLRLVDKIINEGMSVRDIENLPQKSIKKIRKKVLPTKNAHILEVQSKLRDVLGTKVLIKHKDNKGKLEIEYYGEEDLERLLEFFNI